MKIGELSRKTGVQVETIRYYEAQGLLPEPERNAANYREYGEDHLHRLAFIRNCRRMDMAQEEIRSLLNYLDSPDLNCSGVNEVVDEHLGHLEARIAELQMLKEYLARLRRQCNTPQEAADCNILQGLGDLDLGIPAPATHVGGGHSASHRKNHGHTRAQARSQARGPAGSPADGKSKLSLPIQSKHSILGR